MKQPSVLDLFCGAGMLWRLDTAYLAATVSFLTCSFLYGWLNVRSWRLMHRSALRQGLADARRRKDDEF